MNPITSDVFKEDKSLAQKSEDLHRLSFSLWTLYLCVLNIASLDSDKSIKQWPLDSCATIC